MEKYTIAAHYFSNSNEAYDACQVGETDAGVEVNAGDILIIPTEKVVGVCDTWPFAVTKECGSLHAVKDWAAFYKDHPSPSIKSYVIQAVAIASGQDENWI